MIAIAIIVLLLGIVPINVGFLRTQIEDVARDATGMDLSVDGPIVVRLGATPGVSASLLKIGTTPSDSLLTIDSLSAKVSLFALFGGRIEVRSANAENIQVNYCASLPESSGESAAEGAPPTVVVDSVELSNISVRCGGLLANDETNISIQRIVGSAREGEKIQISADGNLNGTDFSLTAEGGDLNALLAEPETYAVSLSLVAETTSINVNAELLTPFEAPGIEASIRAKSDNPQALVSSFGVDMPFVGAFSMNGRVRGNAEKIEFIDVIGEMGQSRIELYAALDAGGARPHVELTATMEQLDLAPFLEPESVASSPDPGADPGDNDLRPVFDALNGFDVNLQLAINQVLGAPMDPGAIEVTGILAAGKADVQIEVAELLGGQWAIDGSVDSHADCPEIKLHAQGNGLDLATLNTLQLADSSIGGHVRSVEMRTTSCGSRIFEHRDSLRAEVDITSGDLSLGGEPLPFVVDSAHLRIVAGERGRLRISGEFGNEKVYATIWLGSLAALMDSDDWPVDVEAQASGGRLTLRGRAGVLSGQPLLIADIDVDVPKIGSLHPWTAGPSNAAEALQGTMRLRLDEEGLLADNIAFSIGASDLSGRAKWRYAGSSEALELTLRSDNLDLDELQSSFVLANDAHPNVAPEVDHEVTSSREPMNLRAIDLDVRFSALKFQQVKMQELHLRGRLREGFIDDAYVSVVVENEVRLEGSLGLDIRPTPSVGELSFSAENVNVGTLMRKFEIVDDLQLRAEDLKLTVTTSGDTPLQFLVNAFLKANMRGFSWKLLRGNVGAEGEPDEGAGLTLTEVTLSAGPGQRTTWTSYGQANGMPLEIWMEAPSLTETFGDNPVLALTLVAAARNNVAKFEGRIDRSVEQGFLADVQVSGAVLKSDGRVLAELPSPLPDYDARGRVRLFEDELSLSDLQIRLGDTEATGQLSITMGEERSRADISLQASHVQTDDLLYWSTDFPQAMALTDSDSDEPSEDENKSESEEGFIFVVGDIIEKFRERGDLELSVVIDELRAGSEILGGAEMRLHIDEDEFSLKPLRIRFPGGDVNAEYNWKITDDRLDAELRVHAEALRYGGLLRLADPESQARGVFYLDTDISANTEWSPGDAALDLLLTHGNGILDFAAWPESAEAGLLDLWTGNLVLAILPAPTSANSTLLNCLVARFDMEEGVLKIDRAMLDSTDTIIRGRGDIDLAKGELDLLVAPQAKREKFLSVSTPVKVTGPLDDFQIGVEASGIIAMGMKWWTSLVYVPFKWLTGERFPADGTPTCFNVMDWELTPELHDYFLQRDFSLPLPKTSD